MIRSIPILALLVAAPWLDAVATEPAPFHHVHLRADDTEKAATWYAEHFGGMAIKNAGFDIAVFGDTLFVWYPTPEPFEGSAGSSVDHIGFSVEDVDAALESLEADGAKIVEPARVLPGVEAKISFIEDPWGVKIEVLEAPDMTGFHHIHLHTRDAAKTLKFYTDVFGGTVESFEQADYLPSFVRYGTVLLLVQEVEEGKTPTQGRAIDHIGWSFENLDASVGKMKSEGVNVTRDVAETPGFFFAFCEGPDGVNIELFQGK